LVGAASLALASCFMIGGAASRNAVVGAVLVSIAAAWSNFVLGAAWAAAIEVGGDHGGVVAAFMNTAGQVGGTISPILGALFLTHLGSWDYALYAIGVLYFLGALCWFLVDPAHRVQHA
jgi:MFS transporter, ACS family, glucarate transporter